MNRIEQIKAEERNKIAKRASKAALRARYGTAGVQKMKAVVRGAETRRKTRPRLDDKKNLRESKQFLKSKGLPTNHAVMRTINSYLGGRKRTVKRKMKKTRRRVKSRRR